MEIYEMLVEANRTDIKAYKRDRLELQTKAITYCDELLFYIEMSHELRIINSDSMGYWSSTPASPARSCSATGSTIRI